MAIMQNKLKRNDTKFFRNLTRFEVYYIRKSPVSGLRQTGRCDN